MTAQDERVTELTPQTAQQLPGGAQRRREQNSISRLFPSRLTFSIWIGSSSDLVVLLISILSFLVLSMFYTAGIPAADGCTRSILVLVFSLRARAAFSRELFGPRVRPG